MKRNYYFKTYQEAYPFAEFWNGHLFLVKMKVNSYYKVEI